jgi:acyl-CoA thioesterase-1
MKTTETKPRHSVIILLKYLCQTTKPLIGLLLLLPLAPVDAKDTNHDDNWVNKKTLLVLGDSLSAGYGIAQGKNWTDLLQQKWHQNNKKIQLINASISGDTTANGRHRLPLALQKFQPTIVLIELGANDGLRGLSLKHIKRNLKTLIQSSLNANATVLLMEIMIPPNYGKKYTQAFTQIYTDLAIQYDITLLPFFLQDIAFHPELMQADGLHPNEQAQPKIADLLEKQLSRFIP